MKTDKKMESSSPPLFSNPLLSSSPHPSPLASSRSTAPVSPQKANHSFPLPTVPLAPAPITVSISPPSAPSPPAFSPPSVSSPPSLVPPAPSVLSPSPPLVSPTPLPSSVSAAPPQVAVPPTLPLSPPSPPPLPPPMPPTKPVLAPPKSSPLLPSTRSSKRSPLNSNGPQPSSTLSPPTHSPLLSPPPPPPPLQDDPRSSLAKKSAASPANGSSSPSPTQTPPLAFPTIPRTEPPPVRSPPGVSFGPTPPSSVPRAVIPSQTKSSGVGSDLSNGTVLLSAGLDNKNTPIAKFSAVVGGLALLGLIALVLYNWWDRKKKKKEEYRFSAGYVGSVSSSDLLKSGYRHDFGRAGSSLRSHHSVQSIHYSPQSLISGSGTDAVGRYQRQDSNGICYSRFFSYQELADATNKFSTQNLLGEGGFGSVYKGRLEDGRLVAVKQLKVGGAQGEREFRAEVETISRIHHRHLVSLVGYCIDYDQKLLIYEFVPNKTLDYHLHGEGTPVMDWHSRVKVAVGAARGITYLHEDCHPRIIHRDIKSSNILLDDNFEAQVSDFGLAKLTVDADSHVTTHVMGTFGYMAPEYASSGQLTDKSDVFSFGVVLLELITGRKPVDTSQPLGDESVVEWARPLLQEALDSKNFHRLADPKLHYNYVGEEMFHMVEAAAACTRYSAELRPRMRQVARVLTTEVDASDLNNGMKPGESSSFNNSQYTEELRMFEKIVYDPAISTIVTSDSSAPSSDLHSHLVYTWHT